MHPTTTPQKSAPATPRAKHIRKAPKSAKISINVAEELLIRTKVLEGLANLQDCLKGLAAQYIHHTNTVLGDHAGALDAVAAMAKFSENTAAGLGSGVGASAQRAASPARSTVEDGKKPERKKRQHDPDAPKRPLTPFFLYMQTARPIIAGDLGPEVAKGAVSNEGTLRWANMDQESKLVCVLPFLHLESTANCSSSGPLLTRRIFVCITLACTTTNKDSRRRRT